MSITTGPVSGTTGASCQARCRANARAARSAGKLRSASAARCDEPPRLVGRLDELHSGHDRFDVGPAIFARLPWTPGSEAVVLREDLIEPSGAPGFRLVLEVTIAREVLLVWSAWRGGRKPDAEEAAAAVIHYAENDAYLPVTNGG